MGSELAAIDQGAVVNFEDYAMSSAGVLRQVSVVHDIMSNVMKLDEHYGTIPGTQKPSLYKPGAEKLGFTFRLRPEYFITRTDLQNGHREYEVVCTLYHIPTGASVGQGVGAATTMEGKYRYRGGEKEGTGQAVPKEYWNLKNSGKTTEALALIGGPGFGVGKIDGKWEVCHIGEKQEHDNPADYYNTVLKMAKKRAHVDAILTATAASDIFTQDVEDMPEVIPGAKDQGKAQAREPQKRQAQENKGNGGKSVNVFIKSVDKKEGEKDGKPYTLFTIIDENDVKYGTFSDTFADLAQQAEKDMMEVSIKFTDGKYGKKIDDLSLVYEPGANG